MPGSGKHYPGYPRPAEFSAPDAFPPPQTRDKAFEAHLLRPVELGPAKTGCATNSAVKKNELPFPRRLSTQMRPPIRRTSSLEIVSPNPVPLYRLATEEST